MTDENEVYFDRETGAKYASPTELVNAYIARFSDKVSTATGGAISFSALDENGFTSISRGSATIGVNVLDAQGVLLFLSRIMDVPAGNREAFYRFLLELNYLATADGAFAIEKETDSVCLRAHRSVAGLDYEEFEEILHTVASIADEWDDRLLEQFGG